MTTHGLSLAGLLAARDASLAVKPRLSALAGLRAKRMAGAFAGAAGVALRALVTALVAVALFAGRHGLVLAGLASFVLAAWSFGRVPGLIVLGLALLFLELRRR